MTILKKKKRQNNDIRCHRRYGEFGTGNKEANAGTKLQVVRWVDGRISIGQVMDKKIINYGMVVLNEEQFIKDIKKLPKNEF